MLWSTLGKPSRWGVVAWFHALTKDRVGAKNLVWGLFLAAAIAVAGWAIGSSTDPTGDELTTAASTTDAPSTPSTDKAASPTTSSKAEPLTAAPSVTAASNPLFSIPSYIAVETTEPSSSTTAPEPTTTVHSTTAAPTTSPPTTSPPTTAQPTTSEPPTTDAPVTSTPSSTVAPDSATTPLALLTATGVPVAILEATNAGYLVRTPCSNTVEVRGGQAIGPVSVVLDPGHGGPRDTGAVGPNGLVERDINLQLSRAVEANLAARGISVVMTRTGDYPTLLSVRAALADQLGAKILVSIHHNAPVYNPCDGPGTEVFVQTGSAPSARLGGLFYESVVAALDRFDIAWTRTADAGVLEVHLPGGGDAYGMIRRPTTPTALLELGYLANGPEADLFATSEYVTVASQAVADAIERYLNSDASGSGFGNPARVFTPGSAPGASKCTDPALE